MNNHSTDNLTRNSKPRSVFKRGYTILLLAIAFIVCVAAATPVPDILVKGTPWYDVRAYSTVANALTAIGSTNASIYIVRLEALSADTTIPANVDLHFFGLGSMSISSGKVLNLSATTVTAGCRTIFSGAGTIIPTKNAMKMEWFGGVAQAFAMLASNPGALTVESNVAVSSDASLPATVSVELLGSGKFTVSNTKTLTLSGSFRAMPGKQVFYSDGAVVPSGLQPLDAAWWPSFAKAVSDLSSNARDLVVHSGMTISSSVSCPATLAVSVAPGGLFNIVTSVTMSFSGAFTAPEQQQVFSSPDAVPVTFVRGSVSTIEAKWFGAKGDNSTDSTLALNQAIKAGGPQVHIPAGTYIIKKAADAVVINLNDLSDLRVFGDGTATIIKNHTDIDTTNYWSQIGVNANTVDAKNITIENLTLDGNTTSLVFRAGYQQQYGVFFGTATGSVSNVTVRNCYVYNHGGDNVFIGSGIHRVLIEGNRFRDGLRQGLCTAGSLDLSDVQIVNNQEEPVTKTTVNGTSIHVEANADTGAITHRTIISGNNVKRSITLNGSDDANPGDKTIISGNHVLGAISTTKVNNLVVADNTIEEATIMPSNVNYMLQIWQCQYGATVTGNLLNGTTTATGGMYFSPSLTADLSEAFKSNILIAHNVINTISDTYYGILASNINRVRVVGNNIDSVQRGVYILNCLYSDVSNNMVDTSSADVDSIYVSSGSSSIAYRAVSTATNNICKTKVTGTPAYSYKFIGVRHIARNNVSNLQTPVGTGAGIQQWYTFDSSRKVMYRNTDPDYGLWSVGDTYWYSNYSGSKLGKVCTVAGGCALGAYNGATTYYIGDYVTYDGHYYESIENSNVGNQPDVSPTKWTDWGASGAATWTAFP